METLSITAIRGGTAINGRASGTDWGFMACSVVLACMAVTGFARDALAQEPVEAGLVNQVSGAVTFSAQGIGSRPAQAFMKVQEGDRFTVPAGSIVRVLYFQASRQETWQGPAAFRVGRLQGEATTGTPLVSALPSAVPAKMARLPQLMQNARLGGGLGGVVIRGGKAPAPLTSEEQDQLAQARGNYGVMRSQAASDDITPELYMISTLQELGQYQEMRPLLQTLKSRQPLPAEVEELVRSMQERLGGS